MHINCTICSDLFVGVDSEVVCATSCGHLFHNHCLLQWYERSLTCPQCRQKQKGSKFTKIFFSIPNTSLTQEDPSALQNKIDCMSFQLKLRDTEIKNQKEDVEKFKKQTTGLREEIRKMKEELSERQSLFYSYQDSIKQLKRECKVLSEYKLEAEELRKKQKDFQSLETILYGVASETDEVLARANLDPSTLSMCVSTFKKSELWLNRSTPEQGWEQACVRMQMAPLQELEISKQRKLDLQEELTSSKREVNKLKSEVNKLKEDISVLNRVNQKLKEDITYSEEDIRTLQQKVGELQSAISSPGESHPRDRALRRLLQEHPAPDNIRAQLDTSTVAASSFEKGSKKSYSPPSPGIAIRKRKEELKMSIFQKPDRVLDLEKLRRIERENEGKVYDGLGGHSKSDDSVFPKFQHSKFKKLTKKKNLSASAASAAKKLKPDPRNMKLDSFFS